MDARAVVRTGLVDYRVDEPLMVLGRVCRVDGYSTAAVAFVCPRCGAQLFDCAFAGRGVVWSYTTVRVDSSERAAPYVLAYVDLDDGPRLVSRVADADAERLRIGARVHLALTDTEVVVARVEEVAA